MAAPFTLRTLGVPQLLAATGESIRFRTRKHFALAIRLAVEPGRTLTRDHLIELLWADAPAHLGRHSLAQAITVLKSKLGRANILIHKSTVALAAGAVDADVTHLDDCDGEIGGRFLEGFEIPSARAFEDWRDAWHAKVLPRIRDCLVRKMDGGRRIGDFATVERNAETLAELDPLSEDALRGIMESRAWVGDRTGALKAYAQFESRLAEELRAKPSADLTRIANLLREGRRSPYRRLSQPLAEIGEKRFDPERLVGRESEFGQLYDTWLTVRHGQPCVTILTGDPGIGKTTLTNAFVSTCQMEGAVVARAQAYDVERDLPFAVLAELIRQLTIQGSIGSTEPDALSELSRICADVLKAFPGVPKPLDWPAEITPLRLADAFLKTISAAAEDSPLVLVIDDVHAADNASIAILHLVARKLGRVRVLLMLSARKSDLRASKAPAALATDAQVMGQRSLELEPLSPSTAARLVRELAAERGLEIARSIQPRILAAANGNPLALALLVREWDAHRTSALLNDLDLLNTLPASSLGIPRAIQAVFDRQVGRFDRRLRSALDLAAVLGRRCAELHLYRVCELSTSQAADALSELCAEGLLREVHGELEFRNELLRAQAYYAITPLARQHLHSSVAEALIGSIHNRAAENWALEVAWHFLRARETHRSQPFVIQGATQALATGAPKEAQQILEAFGTMCGGIQELEPQARLLLAHALMNQSNGQQALPLIEGLLASQSLSPSDRAQTARMAATAEQLLNRDVGLRYRAAAERALALAYSSGESELVARALFESARAGAEGGDEQRISEALEGLRKVLRDPVAKEAAVTHYAAGFCEYYLHRPRPAAAALRRAVALLGPQVDPSELSRVLTGLGVCEVDLCEHDAAADALARALLLAVKVGDDSRASIISANMCMLNLVRGQLAAALEAGLQSVRYAKTALTQPVLSQAYLNLCEVYLMLGELEKADACQELARGWLRDQRNWKANVEFLCQAAYSALLRGNPQEALEMVQGIEKLARGRERAVAPPVGIYLLQIFGMYHMSGPDDALKRAYQMREQYRGVHPLLFLDSVAAVAWLESKTQGQPTSQTLQDLGLFESLGVVGRKLQLVREGFLSEGDSRL